MRKVFARNIDGRGRILRAAMAAVLLLASMAFIQRLPLLGIALFIAGAFVLFEALRGWCALRACGIKTRL